MSIIKCALIVNEVHKWNLGYLINLVAEFTATKSPVWFSVFVIPFPQSCFSGFWHRKRKSC